MHTYAWVLVPFSFSLPVPSPPSVTCLPYCLPSCPPFCLLIFPSARIPAGQVCGDEGWVEVTLVNPCATPLRLEQLQLQTQVLPPQGNKTPQSASLLQQQQQQQSALGMSCVVAGAGERDALPSQQQQQQQEEPRAVTITLPAGSKPTRVLLSHKPTAPGLLLITGVRVCLRGMHHQPCPLLFDL